MGEVSGGVVSPVDSYIINKVRERRMELNISQEHLSFLLGKSEGYISQFESHKRGKHYSTRMLNEIAKALKCSPKDFWPQDPI
jgi:transcriptional regulator with XRE-family HTH domain